MVDEGRYCIDILTQFSAINRVLKGVVISLVDDHLKRCLLDVGPGGPVGEQQLTEASESISRLVRS